MRQVHPRNGLDLPRHKGTWKHASRKSKCAFPYFPNHARCELRRTRAPPRNEAVKGELGSEALLGSHLPSVLQRFHCSILRAIIVEDVVQIPKHLGKQTKLDVADSHLRFSEAPVSNDAWWGDAVSLSLSPCLCLWLSVSLSSSTQPEGVGSFPPVRTRALV